MRRVLAVPAFLFLLAGATEGPVQPIPFSHKQHAGALKLDCRSCHAAPDPGDRMTYPTEAQCMTCHAVVKKESPHIQKLSAAAAEHKSIDWVRIYRLPSFVFWSHKSHLDAGASCDECHGPVAERERLWLEKPISMKACMDCHRSREASNDCTYCHEQRN